MDRNDPQELAQKQITDMIAQRYIDEALAGTSGWLEDRFKNLDVQVGHTARTTETAAIQKAVTRNPDDLWTAEPNDDLNRRTGVPGFWCIFPPKNNPTINHPRAPYIFQTHPDGRRVIYIGPIPPGDPTIQDILDAGNEGR